MLPTFTPQDAASNPSSAPVPQAPLRQGLHAWLLRGWIQAGFAEADFPGDGWDVCPVEDAHLTHKGALLAAKALKLPPRKIAQAWVEALDSHPFVEDVAIVGPGHVNLLLEKASLVVLLGENGTFSPTPAQPSTLIEFVSANPTGPLHLGHARQAVLGSTLVNLLRSHGWTVGTEFYSNDAGNQIDMLVQSVALHMREQLGATLLFERNLDENGKYTWDMTAHDTTNKTGQAAARTETLWFPKQGYHGKDIIELAKSALVNGLDVNDTNGIKAHAIEMIAKGQRLTLERMHVNFDSFASERGLHESGDVKRVTEGLRHFCYRALRAAQETQEPAADAKPAWFLKTTVFGDDKDRVAIKHDGTVPYFVPDVAYHIDKYRRGWERAINIQGSDHHGTLARLRAGIQFLGGPVDYPQTIFHTMVSVLKDGKPLVASKRAGTALSADEIIEMIGVDAFRMSLMSSGPGSELTVDIDSWQAQGLANPVFAVQYASARLHSMLEKAANSPFGGMSCSQFTPQELALAKELLVFRDKMQRAAVALDPVRPGQFVRELAALVHSAYEHSPKLMDLDGPSRKLHIPLFEAARATLVAGLGILGIQAPKQMASLTLKNPPGEASGKPVRP